VKLVLLPGLDGTGVLFRPFIERLPAEVEPIVVSYPVDRFIDYEGLLDLVINRLPVGEPYALLGESFSGPLALMVAAKCPTGLRALVLCATFIQNPTWIRWPPLASFVRPWMFHLYPKLSATKALLGRYSTPELQAQFVEAIAKVRADVFAQRVRAVLSVDVARQLTSCRVPILYLRGSRDWVVPSRNLREIRRISPSVREQVLDAPHMVLQTQPSACANVVRDFLELLTP